MRKRLGLSIKEMAELLETPYRTYQDWELGNRRIPGICQAALECLMRCPGQVNKKVKKKLKKGVKEVFIMGREIILFETEERRSINEVAAFLRQLADKIEGRKVVLRSGAKELDLSLPANLVLEVKVEEEEKKGKTKMSLEVELEWIKGAEDEGGDHIELA